MKTPNMQQQLDSIWSHELHLDDAPDLVILFLAAKESMYEATWSKRYCKRLKRAIDAISKWPADTKPDNCCTRFCPGDAVATIKAFDHSTGRAQRESSGGGAYESVKLVVCPSCNGSGMCSRTRRC